MEKQYDDTNRGTLFTNDRKEEEKHPDYTGSLNVGGVEYRISGWKRTSKAGAKFLSLSVREKTDMGIAPQRPAAPARQTPREEFNDDVPF
jgi:hypothetical protein